jgi:hypothetical protein
MNRDLREVVPRSDVKYVLVPVDKTKARQFVTEWHRHNEAPSAMQVSFAVGLEADGELVGVMTAGRPVARMLDDGYTLEVNRTCVRDFHRNANSRLYGSCARAAKALGYRRLVTYTLQDESGVSLKASGWTMVADIGSRTWSDSLTRVRHDVTIWGERKNAANIAKYRWELAL